MSEHTITRRRFVEVAGIATAATAAGVSMSDSLVNAEKSFASEKIETTILPTSCHGCIQMCPAQAFVENGVITKIQGDKRAPVSRGSLCLKGLNQVHTCYSPRRILKPQKRAGERGENLWEEISWEEAVNLAATNIKNEIDKFGNYAFFASVGGGGAYSFMTAMTIPMAMGSPTVFEPGCAQCYLPRYTIGRYIWGGDCQSIADNDVQEIFKPFKDEQGDVEGWRDAYIKDEERDTNHAEVVVFWAAQPSVSETAESGRGVTELRSRGVKTIVVDPNMSPDATKADVWLPVRPQTDTAMCLGWWRYILENKLYHPRFARYWTNLPFLIDLDETSDNYKLPVKATDLWPSYKSPTPDDTPTYVCYDEKSGELKPLVYCSPEDSDVVPAIMWKGTYNGKEYKTAGQIYWETAEPYTLEKVEEITYVPAELTEKAIRLYAHADEEDATEETPGCVNHVAGITNGVGSDMNIFASQLPIGLMGLDAAMGYINRPGATMTMKGTSFSDPTQERPVFYANGFDGMFSDMFGVGYVIGMSEADNEKRIKELGEKMPESQTILNQLLLDRLGMRDYKGLYTWCHSHIPTVREAIETGEPYRPRVWFDMSGNKLVVLGNAKSWWDVFPDIDFIIGQYPHLTSFHIEAADMVFPLREWLEEPMVNMNQIGSYWLENECTHLGETVSHGIPGHLVVLKVAEMYGGKIPGGLELAPGVPAYLNDGPNEAATKAAVAESLACVGADGTGDWDTLVADANKNYDNFNGLVPMVTPDYWNYDQQEVVISDGLPRGFATESRKFECYMTFMIKLSRTGWPFCYPKPQQACDHDYDPICTYTEPSESLHNEEFVKAHGQEYPLILTSGRVPYFHHGTMRHAAFARELYPAPDVKMNPATAKALGISHMDWVKVSSLRGEIYGRAYLSEGINKDYVWMERFWNPECFDESVPKEKQTAGWRECNVNVLTKNDAPFNECFGSYQNRGIAVKVEKASKPDLVWEDPKEFEPFLPTAQTPAMTSEMQNTKDVF